MKSSSPLAGKVDLNSSSKGSPYLTAHASLKVRKRTLLAEFFCQNFDHGRALLLLPRTPLRATAPPLAALDATVSVVKIQNMSKSASAAPVRVVSLPALARFRLLGNPKRWLALQRHTHRAVPVSVLSLSCPLLVSIRRSRTLARSSLVSRSACTPRPSSLATSARAPTRWSRTRSSRSRASRPARTRSSTSASALPTSTRCVSERASYSLSVSVAPWYLYLRAAGAVAAIPY
jgi:hypothetical protein